MTEARLSCPCVACQKRVSEVVVYIVVKTSRRPHRRTISLYVDHPATTANAASAPMMEQNHT